MEFSKKPFIEHGLDGAELARETALETHADVHAGLLNSPREAGQVLGNETERFFNDEMFAGLRGADAMRGVIARQTANRNHLDLRVAQHLVQLIVGANAAPVFGLKFGFVEFAGGANRGDLARLGGVDGRDMCGRRPAVADHSDVEFFHGQLPGWTGVLAMPVI
jgi:hypothetical protein